MQAREARVTGTDAQAVMPRRWAIPRWIWFRLRWWRAARRRGRPTVIEPEALPDHILRDIGLLR